MDIKLNSKDILNDDELYTELEKISNNDISEVVKQQLILLFSKTKSYKISDKIAIIFADLKDDNLIPVIINKIKENKNSNHIGTLVYACSEYDCADYISFFVELVIEFSNSVQIEAISVLEEIRKPIIKDAKTKNIKILSNYLNSLNKEEEFYHDVKHALEVVENLEVK